MEQRKEKVTLLSHLSDNSVLGNVFFFVNITTLDRKNKHLHSLLHIHEDGADKYTKTLHGYPPHPASHPASLFAYIFMPLKNNCSLDDDEVMSLLS